MIDEPVSFTFTGEESARFARLGKFVTEEAGLHPVVVVDGREPLTARSVELHGRVMSATFEGYVRFLVLREEASGVDYWIGGSNATLSVAAHSVTFVFTQSDLSDLVQLAQQMAVFVPALAGHSTETSEVWRRLDAATSNVDLDTLEFLKESLTSADTDVEREAALDIRAFVALITQNLRLRRDTEQVLLGAIERTKDPSTKIALIENLGYIGTEVCLNPLKRLLDDPRELDQARWAAAIALGRISGGDVLPTLMAAVETTRDWTRLGVVLSLTRRAEDVHRSELEPLFRRLATSPENDRNLQRYACVGLSKFSDLETTTIDVLVNLLGDFDLPLAIRGYAALALSTSLRDAEDDSLRDAEDERRKRISDVLATVSAAEVKTSTGPETIWGLEFLADLASLLDQDSVAAKLYVELAHVFGDWHSQYYQAIAEYQLGEASPLTPDGSAAIHFREAYRLLGEIHPEESNAKVAIEFRRDIVEARIMLDSCISEWSAAVNVSVLQHVASGLETVSSTFRRYAQRDFGEATREGLKRLSEREVANIAATASLVSIIASFVRFEAEVRSGSLSLSGAAALLQEVLTQLDALESQLGEHHSRAVTPIARETRKRVQEELSLIQDGNLEELTRSQSLRSYLTEMRGLFARTRWPMPAVACPVGGLGRGKLTVVTQLEGSGRQDDPYIFPKESPVIINVVAHIEQMAPGAGTGAQILCLMVGHSDPTPVHATDGPAPVSIQLREELIPTYGWAVCKLQLQFYAPHCDQIVDEVQFCVRRAL